MNSPRFFDDAPTIEMIDPLADLLGAATDGRFIYKYADAVKLAGHSCPTVAGAFLMTKQALAHLYGEEIPVRGNIRVNIRDAVDDGVTGVIGNVIGLITGAAGPGGFKGIGGQFNRAGLLNYSSRQIREVHFTRLDNGQSIGADYDPSAVAPDEKQTPLMRSIMSGAAGPEEVALFKEIWQKRVATILTSSELWPVMVQLG